MKRKILFTIFKYLFSFQGYSSFQKQKICKLPPKILSVTLEKCNKLEFSLGHNVSVKSKLKHPPPPPGNLPGI